MLVQLFYKNEETFRARVMGAAPTQSELDYARLIFDRYVQMVRSEIGDVSVTRVPVTEDVLEDVRASIYGLSRFMTHEEYGACQQLLDLLEEVRDFSIQDGIDYMNLETTRLRVHAILEGVTGWDTSYDPQ